MTEVTAAEPVQERDAPVRPTGYRLILPPGWVGIPLRKGTAEALEKLVFVHLKELPPDVPRDQGMKYRLAVRRDVEAQVAQAGDVGGLDLYLPVGPRYGALIAASFLVTEVRVADADGHVQPDLVLERLSEGNGNGVATEVLELAGTTAVRREYVQQPAPDRDVHVPSRHIEYALAVPQDPMRYIAVSFSTIGDGNPESDFTQALGELFDALMTTFRWTSGHNGDTAARQTESSAQ